METKIAIVGCGYVADMYMHTLANYPDIHLKGAFDINPQRLQRFSSYFDVRPYHSFEELLADDVDIVVNLTNPNSHFEVSKLALQSGKHVYSEKPLAATISQGKQLAEIAKQEGVYLSCAPCNVLSEAAQTALKTIKSGKLGKVCLVYAELDDGLMHSDEYLTWFSPTGAQWPHKDEFETGCTLEHAAYYVSWLVAAFGPAKKVTAFSKTLIEDKGIELSVNAPDFSCGFIEFHSGVVARLTCSIVTNENRSMQVFGSEAILSVQDSWDYGSKLELHVRSETSQTNTSTDHIKHIPLVRPFQSKHPNEGCHRMDFFRGIADLAQCIEDSSPLRLSAEFALHVDEICHAIQAGAYEQGMTTQCSPLPLMDWAADSYSA